MSTPQQFASPESTNQYQPQPPVPPMPNHKPKSKRKWLVPLIVAVALLFGTGIGAASKPTPPIPDPVTIEKVVEKRVEVPTTPAACSTAFGYAEDVFSSSARTVGYMQTMLKAAGRLDAAGITAEGPKIDTETTLLGQLGPKYRSAKADCLAAVK